LTSRGPEIMGDYIRLQVCNRSPQVDHGSLKGGSRAYMILAVDTP
jgi:hypothetical protein